MLSLLGTAAGIAFATVYLHWILISMPPEVARYLYSWNQIGLNLPVLGAAIVLALLSGLVAGLTPARGHRPAGGGDGFPFCNPHGDRYSSLPPPA